MLNINSKEWFEDFGEFVRKARMEKEIPQWKLGEELGMTQAYISHIERGERVVDLFLAFRICDKLNVDIREFLTPYIDEAEDVKVEVEVELESEVEEKR